MKLKQRNHAAFATSPRTIVLLLALVFIAIKLLKKPPSVSHANGHPNGRDHGGDATANTYSNRQKKLTFTCSDGRTGIHIVHTRFLVGQPHATPLFVASRLQLMRTFLIPSLNAQSTKQWVYYASYDPGLGSSAARGFEDALSSVQAAYTIAHKEPMPAGGDWSHLNFSAVTDTLAAVDPGIRDVDFFITSRIDNDDATHFDTVASFQRYACSAAPYKRGSTTSSTPVRLAYPQGGQLWFPSAREHYGAAGAWKTSGKGVDDLYRVMSIMPTMVLTGKDFVRQCSGKLNCYSMRHYQPEDLETLNIEGCKYRFSARKNILYWDPPEGDISYLYVRTPSSWTKDKEDLKYRTVALDIVAMERSFQLSPASMAATNLLFAGFQKEAPDLLNGKGSTDIE